MGLLAYDSKEVPIPIRDLVVDGTIVKRTASMINLDYNWREWRVVINLYIEHYSRKENGDYGGRFTLIPSYVHSIIADNTTICDAATGIPICPTKDEAKENQEIVHIEVDGAYIARPGLLFEKDYRYQYDFFKKMGREDPILVDQMIKQFIMLADIVNQEL